jgi:(E)-4-hydroxy-3-methylbut-2-enyl-diphosphate synthase
VAQIRRCQLAGCDIIRLAVIDEEAARAVGPIRAQVAIPLIADIHFNHRLALIVLDAGVDGLRINPGNIGGAAHVREVVNAAQACRAPIRIGVNAGSLETDILAAHGGATPAALVESALRHIRLLEDAGCRAAKVSVKASDVPRTVAAYRLLAEATDCPLHLGVTEAGTFLGGTVRSSVALGILLAEGIGDTIRVSLTDAPEREVRVGLELLRSLGLRDPGPAVVSCPTCGRCQVDVVGIANRVESELERLYIELPPGRRPIVAVMGCMVNGPGEAREADLALAGGDGKFALHAQGAYVRSVPETEAVSSLVAAVREWCVTHR